MIRTQTNVTTQYVLSYGKATAGICHLAKGITRRRRMMDTVIVLDRNPGGGDS